MKPNANAKELVDRFIPHQSDDYPNADENNHAKQCALICVEETIQAHKTLCFNIGMTGDQMKQLTNDSFNKYWNKVKEEINKL
jgi:hypothetical protein